MQEYADPVIDWLDGGRGLFGKKLYREVSVSALFAVEKMLKFAASPRQSCSLQPNGSYIKDLSLVEEDLSRVCFVDNSPVSYNWNKGVCLGRNMVLPERSLISAPAAQPTLSL
jgi:CTD nuclear envelope phosphatase 1